MTNEYKILKNNFSALYGILLFNALTNCSVLEMYLN